MGSLAWPFGLFLHKIVAHLTKWYARFLPVSHQGVRLDIFKSLGGAQMVILWRINPIAESNNHMKKYLKKLTL